MNKKENFPELFVRCIEPPCQAVIAIKWEGRLHSDRLVRLLKEQGWFLSVVTRSDFTDQRPRMSPVCGECAVRVHPRAVIDKANEVIGREENSGDNEKNSANN